MMTEEQIKNLLIERSNLADNVKEALDDWEASHPNKFDENYLLGLIDLRLDYNMYRTQAELMHKILNG